MTDKTLDACADALLDERDNLRGQLRKSEEAREALRGHLARIRATLGAVRADLTSEREARGRAEEALRWAMVELGDVSGKAVQEKYSLSEWWDKHCEMWDAACGIAGLDPDTLRALGDCKPSSEGESSGLKPSERDAPDGSVCGVPYEKQTCENCYGMDDCNEDGRCHEWWPVDAEKEKGREPATRAELVELAARVEKHGKTLDYSAENKNAIRRLEEIMKRHMQLKGHAALPTADHDYLSKRGRSSHAQGNG